MKKAKLLIVLLVLLGAATLAEAQIVVSSTMASTYRIKEKSGREKGWVIRPEVGAGLASGNAYGTEYYLLGSGNYQFNPFFSLGGGAGVTGLFWWDSFYTTALFADARAYFCDRKWSPFIDLKLGYNIAFNGHYDHGIYGCVKGYLAMVSLGCQYKQFDFGWSSGLFNIYNNYCNNGGVMFTVNVAYNFPLNK